MRFIITEHARERLRERIGCLPAKDDKIIGKAWRSQEPVDSCDITNEKYYTAKHAENNEVLHYRKLMGRIFVFVTNTSGVVTLISVVPTNTAIRKLTKPSRKQGEV